jgi:undecaprenyl-diphosphatase
MTILQAFVLGFLQGATEFIPVSSSGHLTLVPWLLNWEFDPVFKGAFDVLTHWGTLTAIVAVFWRDLWQILLGGLRTLNELCARCRRRTHSRGLGGCIERDAQGRLAWLILIGSVPAAVLGFLLEDFFEMLFGAPRTVSLLLLVTAGLLAFSEWKGRRGRDLDTLTWRDALLIGLGQAMAIAPGISRSGATIASGLMRGVKRDAAARFSFLLSTPIIVGAGVWQLKDLFANSGWTAYMTPLIVGFVIASVTGYACIRFLLSYLRQHKLYAFALYCTLAGIACLIVSFVR